MGIQIGTRTVGPDDKPFIIAEIGSNWKNVQECVDSVRLCAQAGADCVKFQMFHAEGMYGAGQKPRGYSAKNELDPDMLQPIKTACDEAAVELMISAFDEESLRLVDPFVNAHKVASSKLSNPYFLEAVAGLGKPIFLSIGGHHEGAVGAALACLRDSQVILNYCVAAYSNPKINLQLIEILREKYARPIGFSDHTMDYDYLPWSAIHNHGAVAIEKHVKAVPSDGPDASHSLSLAQFRMMVQSIGGRRRPNIGPTLEELDMRSRHHDRPVSTADIKKGEQFVLNANFQLLRSTVPALDHLDGFDAPSLEGMEAARPVKAWKSITRDDIA